MDKFCRNCGSPLNGQVSFCSRCGIPVNMASAGMEYGHPNNSGFGPAPAPAPASGSNSSNAGNLITALIAGAVMVGLACLPYAGLGPVSLTLMDSSDVWLYFVCVAILVVGDLIDQPVLSLIGGAASILFNLYEVGDAENTLGMFSGALDLSGGFWLIMFFSACAVFDGVIGLWRAKNGQ